jgi:heme-degrading monooxygenase HmoA
MYSRIVYLTLKTNAATEFAKALEQKVVPMLRGEPGFQDELLFITPGGPEVVAVSIWDSREDAENYARSAYPRVLRAIERFITGTPRVESYQLGYSTLHRTGLSEFPKASPITTPVPGVGGG